jgi:hypothetical protein
MVRQRAVPSHLLGFHRATAVFIGLQLALLGVTTAAFVATDLRLAWHELLDVRSFVPAVIWATWVLHVSTPGKHPREWVIGETLLVLALLLTFSHIGGPLQYAIIALNVPVADGWLAEADALMGVHVPTLVSWTSAHPALTSILRTAYLSLLPQFVLPVVVLGCWYRDRRALWEYAWHFQICLVAALVGLSLFPAACAFSYYGFESLLDQTRFATQFEALRNGTMTVVHPKNLEGMITFPSFHAAGGLLVTWSFRRYPVWFAALGCLNALLIASTVLTGAHYAIDVLAAAGVFAVSVLVWRRLAAAWIGPSTEVSESAVRDVKAA